MHLGSLKKVTSPFNGFLEHTTILSVCHYVVHVLLITQVMYSKGNLK